MVASVPMFIKLFDVQVSNFDSRAWAKAEAWRSIVARSGDATGSNSVGGLRVRPFGVGILALGLAMLASAPSAASIATVRGVNWRRLAGGALLIMLGGRLVPFAGGIDTEADEKFAPAK